MSRKDAPVLERVQVVLDEPSPCNKLLLEHPLIPRIDRKVTRLTNAGKSYYIILLLCVTATFDLNRRRGIVEGPGHLSPMHHRPFWYYISDLY